MKNFLNAFNKAVAHNQSNDKKKSFTITYKKMNGRTVKRKIDPMNVRNNMVVAYDHKRKAVRSFKIERMKGMEKAAFLEGFEKAASVMTTGKKLLGKAKGFVSKHKDSLHDAGEIAGLGTLAVPSIQALRGKDMDEHKKHKYELAGLGILAAPYAKNIGSKILRRGK